MTLLLSAVLTKPYPDLEWVMGVLSYRQQRNHAAYQSHRRRRLTRLRAELGRSGERILELSL